MGARQDNQLVIVELVVRYRDQGLMATAVVPAQHAFWSAFGDHQTENALEVAGAAFVLFFRPVTQR